MSHRYHKKHKNHNNNNNRPKGSFVGNSVPSSQQSNQHTAPPSQRLDNKDASVEDLSRYPKKYGIMFFENINELIDNFEKALSKSRTVDKLNIVIHTDEIPKTNKFPNNITVYTGEVWWNIHKNRVEEGWYVGYTV